MLGMLAHTEKQVNNIEPHRTKPNASLCVTWEKRANQNPATRQTMYTTMYANLWG